MAKKMTAKQAKFFGKKPAGAKKAKGKAKAMPAFLKKKLGK
ncbi:hypothetical protein C8D77_11192 [Mesorhizobium loti]|uniref:Uncharacterized protein n=1 Tax=Rhizobium loti TaxID=381 RepID=A0A8E2WB88_RHILI|nr:hypothetical protein [Mesorhizobium loti]PWJ88370.1 hypothetical protein C8D77_11192 [Mesorhizobium loti]